MKEKIKVLVSLLGLILLPILANVLHLIFYPVFCVGALFLSEKEFYERIKIYKDSFAKL